LILAFHKPCGVLSQFTPDGSPNRSLAEFGFPSSVYPIGRLDADSEGLLLLSDEPQWNARLLAPGRHVTKTYWALVERSPSVEVLAQLESGIPLEGKLTLPASARILDPQPNLPPRDPPVRVRKSVSDFWIELQIHEGRNRQIRRMTAAVGHPTIRLLRVAIAEFSLGDLKIGAWKEISPDERLGLLVG